ncbi:hypothetical protein BDY21DRAFT_375040 [Lineolata rhizophorae]|uniref:Uncharacterized protein n=1 Tax=Lineolata rhizophorae TaxID=578093 RepID=A0A6A6NNB3_9PEZI|nr:hypothetical protein BDY21DRAFT_375040 [Lineolata rhizophorae]
MARSPDNSGYVPIPSVGHELGVMFGFVGVFVVATIIYGFVWTAVNKRGLCREEERVAGMRELLRQRETQGEKLLVDDGTPIAS